MVDDPTYGRRKGTSALPRLQGSDINVDGSNLLINSAGEPLSMNSMHM